MKLCNRCKKRPAVVFVSDASNPSVEPQGLCLVCAKEMGIRPIDDMLKKMNISDEDIEMMSEQFMEMMAPNGEMDDENFEMGGAPTFPFLNNIFGSFQNAAGEETPAEENEAPKDKKGHAKKEKRRRFIDQYCTNLSERAKTGKLDKIIGREEELYRAIQILSRRSKNNPCLIGEPGVGKTAIAEGLAIKIAAGDVPARLMDKEIHMLDLTGLVAGTQFRGQFESRIKGLIEELKTQGNIILFIDEVHNLVGAGDSEGSMGAANILKPALSRGEIQVIGATTFTEYRKYIEKDAALERRFQPIVVEEPSIADTEKMLRGIKGYYEGYHSVQIPDSVVSKVVYLSERYINDRFLPDKAIDLLDEACACASLRNKAIDELYLSNKKIAELSKEKEEIENNVDSPDYERIASLKSEIAKYQSKSDALCGPASENIVTDSDLAKVIELWTGIPASKIEESDFAKLRHLENDILERIIGQDEAVKLVSKAVKRSRVQTSAHRRPASFIFVGPTGVGKTELAKVLSEQLFNTPETLIRLDMSEFMEKHSVSRIIGAPPGYVGYDEAGQLTEKIRRKPYSVILFDEIEKAHPDVLNILLQILDDGRITDAQGRTVNFENTIVIITSNAGSNNTESLMGFGVSQAKASRDKAIKALEEFLRPEFIARVDEIVVFEQLSEDSMVKIAALMLDELVSVMAEKDITVTYDKNVCKELYKLAGSGKHGARDLRNQIRKNIEDGIVERLLDNAESNISELKIVAKNGIKVL